MTKVVNLVKDVLKQLEKEAEENEEIYDQLACWCETNDKGKTKSIDLQFRSRSCPPPALASTLRSSTSTRMLQRTRPLWTQLADFIAEEKDLLLSIDSLKTAINQVFETCEEGSWCHDHSARGCK